VELVGCWLKKGGKETGDAGHEQVLKIAREKVELDISGGAGFSLCRVGGGWLS
jgi:hypothetical protein